MPFHHRKTGGYHLAVKGSARYFSSFCPWVFPVTIQQNGCRILAMGILSFPLSRFSIEFPSRANHMAFQPLPKMWDLPTSRSGSGRRGIAPACGSSALDELQGRWAVEIRKKGGELGWTGLNWAELEWPFWGSLMIWYLGDYVMNFSKMDTDPAFSRPGWLVQLDQLKPLRCSVEGRMILWLRMIFKSLIIFNHL